MAIFVIMRTITVGLARMFSSREKGHHRPTRSLQNTPLISIGRPRRCLARVRTATACLIKTIVAQSITMRKDLPCQRATAAAVCPVKARETRCAVRIKDLVCIIFGVASRSVDILASRYSHDHECYVLSLNKHPQGARHPSCHRFRLFPRSVHPISLRLPPSPRRVRRTSLRKRRHKNHPMNCCSRNPLQVNHPVMVPTWNSPRST